MVLKGSIHSTNELIEKFQPNLLTNSASTLSIVFRAAATLSDANTYRSTLRPVG